MKQKYTDISQIWTALDKGTKVFWEHEGYAVRKREIGGLPGTVQKMKEHFSCRDNQVLEVTYLENGFSSLLEKSCVKKCFARKGCA